MSYLDQFFFYDCACCGEQIAGQPTYLQGAFHCAPCARGEHRHPRRAA